LKRQVFSFAPPDSAGGVGSAKGFAGKSEFMTGWASAVLGRGGTWPNRESFVGCAGRTITVHGAPSAPYGKTARRSHPSPLGEGPGVRFRRVCDRSQLRTFNAPA